LHAGDLYPGHLLYLLAGEDDTGVDIEDGEFAVALENELTPVSDKQDVLQRILWITSQAITVLPAPVGSTTRGRLITMARAARST
jgi:hypothetical protein